MQIMEKVIRFRTSFECIHLRESRASFGLSVVQAARALNVSPSRYEKMEQGVISAPSEPFTDTHFAIFIDQEGPDGSNNLVFDTLPLRTARKLLGLPLGEMASIMGCKESTLKKYEANGRVLCKEDKGKIEALVRSRVGEMCS